MRFDPFSTHFWCHNGPLSSNFGIFHGPKGLATGSKRTKNTCCSIPNGPRSVLGNCFLDPFLVPRWPIFKAFWCFPWAKTRHRGLKAGEKTCLSIPNGPRSLLPKHPFDPPLTHFWSQNIPFARNFGVLCGSQCVTTGSKWAKTTCWSIPSGPASLLGKCVLTHFQPIFGPTTAQFQAILAFSKAQNVSPRAQNGLKTLVGAIGMVQDQFWEIAFLTHFWFQDGPFSRHFGVFHGLKRVTAGSKRAKKLV